jgi:hypothetical protein
MVLRFAALLLRRRMGAFEAGQPLAIPAVNRR